MTGEKKSNMGYLSQANCLLMTLFLPNFFLHRNASLQSGVGELMNWLMAVTRNTVLDRWDKRLKDIFEGCPYDTLDATFTDALYKFPLDIKVLKSWINKINQPHFFRIFEYLTNVFLTAF